MTLAESLYKLLPGSAYSGNIDDSTEAQYDAIEWCDNRPKPSWADCVAMMESDHTPTWYSPSKIIRALDAMGQADALEAALIAAPARQRLLWQKEPRFNGEYHFTGLVDYFQFTLGMTDEQRAAFLKQCEEDKAADQLATGTILQVTTEDIGGTIYYVPTYPVGLL